jgi:hypothetical protein
MLWEWRSRFIALDKLLARSWGEDHVYNEQGYQAGEREEHETP